MKVLPDETRRCGKDTNEEDRAAIACQELRISFLFFACCCNSLWFHRVHSSRRMAQTLCHVCKEERNSLKLVICLALDVPALFCTPRLISLFRGNCKMSCRHIDLTQSLSEGVHYSENRSSERSTGSSPGKVVRSDKTKCPKGKQNLSPGTFEAFC